MKGKVTSAKTHKAQELQLQVYRDSFYNTVKPLFTVFVGGLKKKQWIRENNRCGSHS
jgi:hypothetical protein